MLALVASVLALPVWAAGPTPATGPTTSLPLPNGGSLVKVPSSGSTGGLPGAQTDSADFFGILVALAVIVVAIVIVRAVFRYRGSPGREERPAAPGAGWADPGALGGAGRPAGAAGVATATGAADEAVGRGEAAAAGDAVGGGDAEDEAAAAGDASTAPRAPGTGDTQPAGTERR